MAYTEVRGYLHGSEFSPSTVFVLEIELRWSGPTTSEQPVKHVVGVWSGLAECMGTWCILW